MGTFTREGGIIYNETSPGSGIFNFNRGFDSQATADDGDADMTWELGDTNLFQAGASYAGQINVPLVAGGTVNAPIVAVTGPSGESLIVELPLGTFVRVTNLGNGKTVDVRVNDRGPFVRGRVIDLSYTAAKRMNMLGPGTARVKVVALGAPKPKEKKDGPQQYVPIDYYSGKFTLQVGAFTEKANAERLVAKLGQRHQNAHMAPYFDGQRTFYRVRVGTSSNLKEAEAYEQRLVREGFGQAFIVAE